MNDWNKITIYCGDNGDRDAADMLSRQLGVPLADSMGEALTLVFDGSGLSLVGSGMRYQGDFSRMLSRVTKGRLHHEMLVKLAKTKTEHPVAVDAAAGMGEDSFLLAAAGYEVYLFERDRVIAALLGDALRRAEKDEQLRGIVGRMHLKEGDSIELMPQIGIVPEIVYLDPMFPPRKKSGLIHKKLQLIQKLEQPCADERELFDAAAALHPKKIIIKRPLNGAPLADRKPSYTVKGKAIRYDVVVI
ncbi:class I SAM-dependent methyltransferase [Ruminococcus sp.]|uniref:class I SAM-dependent methyltransferase n=1 Tax=Ruminococcus sp. TaxID=41978 RepID=UPI002E80DFF5|nr:class I SAM-dependent methyltransferase [Ruminococcus sp.]MEE3492564.1 class I SAM-dependent methyltransferase [Ruminococcus sp.]